MLIAELIDSETKNKPRPGGTGQKEGKMITTKGQCKRIYNGHHGYGWLVFRSGDNEITEIEIFVGKDNRVRRVGDGKPLFPFELVDEDGNTILAS